MFHTGRRFTNKLSAFRSPTFTLVNPPPAEVADRVVQRADDREETVRERFSVYRAQTAPLVAFYRDRGVPIHDLDGDRAIDAVQADLQSRVGL
jgi:adenylate kinase